MRAPVRRPGSTEDVGDLDRGTQGSTVGGGFFRLEQAELVERTRNRADRLGRHLGVEGGVVEFCVPEQDLDDPNVRAVLQQVGGEAVAQKKLVMLCPCRTTFNPGATFSLCPLPQPQTPSRAAGSFFGPKTSHASQPKFGPCPDKSVTEEK